MMAFSRKTQILTVDLSRKRLPRKFAQAATRALNRLFGFDQFNAVYDRLAPCEAEEFSGNFLYALDVRVEIAGQTQDTIPANGPLIVVANHPHGLLDGMVLEALLRPVRSDVTIMAIYLMAAIPEYRDRWIFVGRPKSRSKRKLSVRGWRRSLQWLAQGGVLVVFPAGRVSRFRWRLCSIADRPWNWHVAAIARRSGASVLPIYLHGPRHWGSQLLGIVSPLLQNIRAIGGVTKFRGQTMRASIGRLIHPDDLRGFATDEAATAFLRQQTDRLAQSR